MVKRYGMSTLLGNITYGHPVESRYLKTGFAMEDRDYSEKTAQGIDEEVRRIVDESHGRVKAIVIRRRQELDCIVRRLIEKETIEEDEVQEIVSNTGFRHRPEELVPDTYEVAPDIDNGVYAAKRSV
jgi:cell division protease FtsH